MNQPLETPRTLQEAIVYFSDPDRCLDYLTHVRWPDGVVVCPTCGGTDTPFQPSRKLWKCKNNHARRQFSIKVGTIMEDSALGLEKWLPAMWLIGNDKNGIGSYELGRALGVTQKSSWHMLHRIRLAMQDDSGTTLGGEVEVDETFIGGKARFMHKNRRENTVGRGSVGKTAVMGLLERHGPDGHSTVRTQVIPNTRRASLSPRVRKHVEFGATVYTDALKSYDDLSNDYIHGVIDHAESYVRGKVHTNGIENFWSLVKRALKGTYVSVEPFQLFRYLDEEAFRFKHRETNDGTRFARVVSSVVGKRLTYAELTGAGTTPA
jgi:transposase-like protein